MASISQETNQNPAENPESSNTSSINTSFSFEIKPASKLKLALLALSDRQFNPNGLARMDVDHHGFQLTVWNVATRVVANLRVRANDSTNFCFNHPLEPKMINLRSFCWDLYIAADYSIVSIYHLQDSNLLCFTYGSGTEANKEFSVDLTELDSNFRKYPGFTCTYGTTMQTTHLRYMISPMEHEEIPQRVLVQITEHNASITVGDRKWRYRAHEVDGIKQANSGEEHKVWFQWPHVNSIMKASLLKNKVFLGFDTSGAEENTLMMRFFVKETWDLTYIRLKSCPKEIKASERNPSINSFSFEMKPAGNLKQAIAALCDQEFNPRGLGRIDVDDQCFELTVWNMETRVIGHLRLCANDTNNYSYSSPLEPNMIDLNRVFSGLEFAADDDIVFIYHLHGSNLLGFKFGCDPVAEFSVDLTELDSNFQKVPGFTPIRGTSIPTQDLRQMIPFMVQEGTPQTVSLSVKDENVSIIIGERKRQGQVLQERKVWFEWPHGDALMKASRLEELYYLGFGTSDVKCDTLMMRFFVKERWNLAFIRLNCCFLQTD